MIRSVRFTELEEKRIEQLKRRFKVDSLSELIKKRLFSEVVNQYKPLEIVRFEVAAKKAIEKIEGYTDLFAGWEDVLKAYRNHFVEWQGQIRKHSKEIEKEVSHLKDLLTSVERFDLENDLSAGARMAAEE